MNVSDIIRKRILASSAPFAANDHIAKFIHPEELDLLEDDVAQHMQGVLNALVIDTDNDPNTKDTAKRVARMFIREVFAGRYIPQPDFTDFPNAKKLDELYTLGPIEVRSACSHHLCPVQGDLWVGIVPKEKLIGISKFSRLSRWIMARPQIQEEAIVQIADLLERLIEPRGLAVVLKATHSCMTWRGTKEHDTTMVTAVVRGIIKTEAITRDEFYRIIAAQGFVCR